jgi:hypothetical protein
MDLWSKIQNYILLNWFQILRYENFLNVSLSVNQQQPAKQKHLTHEAIKLKNL